MRWEYGADLTVTTTGIVLMFMILVYYLGPTESKRTQKC